MTDEELTQRFDEIKSDIKREGVTTRRHFDIVAEKMKALALETRQTKLEEGK